MRRPRFVFSLLACSMIGAIAFAACNSDGRTLRPAGPGQTQTVYTPTTTTEPATTIAAETIAPATVAVTATIPVGGALTTTTQTPLAFALNMPWGTTGLIDARFTCHGADTQPQFSWLGAPKGAVEMALIGIDLDAGNFVHWIIAGLDPLNPLVAEGGVPTGAIQAQNGTSTAARPSIGWHGPCPPPGTTHHYQFTLYALSQQMELPDGSPAAAMQSAIIASAIGAAQVTATYTAP